MLEQNQLGQEINNQALNPANLQSLPTRLQEKIKNNPIPSVAVGVGIIVATPILFRLLKPVAKAALRSGFSLYEKTKLAVAESAESFGDIVAEAKAEAVAEAEKKAKIKAGLLSKQTHLNNQ